MKLLMIATSHAGLCALGHPTGLWLEELAVPYYAFVGAGYEVTIASVKGGQVPLDPLGLELVLETPEEVGRFIVDPRARDLIAASSTLADLDASGAADHFQAAFLPGGYGAMFDLPDCLPLGRILAQMLAGGRLIGAVGHGLAGLISAHDASGQPAIAGRRLTCFSNAEEAALGLCDYVPFLLETRVCELGAIVQTGPEFKAFVCRDGNLITGQNPASTKLVAEAMLGILRE